MENAAARHDEAGWDRALRRLVLRPAADELRPHLVVRMTEPTLLTDLASFLAGTVKAGVVDRQSHLEIELRDGEDPAAQLERVRRLARAWQMNGHLDVRTEVELAGGEAETQA